MARRPDHIVHAVHDLDALAEFYRRAGFSVGKRNRHPWGTHNHVVQVPSFFVELLTVAEPERLRDDGLSQQFGRFQQRAIARRDGYSMLLLASSDAAGDARDWQGRGIGVSGVLPFSREAVLADGRTATVGFALAFARDPASPGTGFAVCQHRNPDAFWSAALQAHPNGVQRLRGIVLTATQPAEHRTFLDALVGDDVALAGLEVMSPVDFRDRFGTPAPDDEGLSLAAVVWEVSDMDRCRQVIQQGGITSARCNGALVLDSKVAYGAVLVFEGAGPDQRRRAVQEN